MNRKNLTAAVLAGLAGVAGIAGSAQAVNINPDGLGQLLIYPYYTTNGDNLTVLSVVNTTANAKAVKVRFLESENSQEVLDFNLYMSAYDVWTAAIMPQPEVSTGGDLSCDDPTDDEITVCEGPRLEIAPDENTCIVPDFGKTQSFLPFAFANDGGTQDHARMNEGHFEIIEMGILTDEGFDPEDAATHAKLEGGGWGPDCETLNDAWRDPNDAVVGDEGEWRLDATEGIGAPNGGLFGGAAVVNVMSGALHSYDATALNGWSESGFDGFFSNHTNPGNTKPSLDSGDNMEAVVFLDNGDVFESGMLNRSVDAVSFVFMHDSMMNEYTTEDGVAGATEWVVTFPTKRFYVDDDFAQLQAPLAPFTTEWGVVDKDVYAYATACETVSLSGIFDREERIPGDPTCEQTGTCGDPDDPIVSPPPPGVTPPPPPGIVPFQLCYEANVIRFGSRVDLPAATEILGSPMPNYRNIDNKSVDVNDQYFQYGWAQVELDDYVEDTNQNGQIDDDEYYTREAMETDRDDQYGLNGLPFAGFAVNRFSNGYLEDDEGNKVLSSYGSLFSHKATRKITSSGY
jgi:hypothetical protein